MGAYIERTALDLTVLGQVQCDYAVDGVPGFALGEACVASTFKRVVSIEDELSAMGAAVKRRNAATQVYAKSMSEISAACACIGSKTEDAAIDEAAAITAVKAAKAALESARLDTGMFNGINMDNPKVSDLRKLREDIKFQTDQEANALQRNASMIQSVLKQRDGAVALIAKLRRRLDKTMSTSIRNIGR